MSEKLCIVIGGFSEGPTVLDPFANALVDSGIGYDAAVYTAAEYRATPVTDTVADTAFFTPHSAGIIALAESFARDPRKYTNSAIAALNGVEPTGLPGQIKGAITLGTEKIDHEEHLPSDIASPKYPARELATHMATTAWIPRQVRKFSTTQFLGRFSKGYFNDGKMALWSDDDSFGFTPNEEELAALRAQGVYTDVFPGKHNEILFRPNFAASVISAAIDAAQPSL